MKGKMKREETEIDIEGAETMLEMRMSRNYVEKKSKNSEKN